MGKAAAEVHYILLADDDADDRMLFEEALSEIGAPVSFSAVKDGIELIKYLRGSGIILPQIIFLDLNMPLKNGFQCLQEIRNMKAFDDIFIILFSTTARPGDIDAGFQKGANLFIQKPNSYSDLKNVLRQIITTTPLNYHPARDQFVFRIS